MRLPSVPTLTALALAVLAPGALAGDSGAGAAQGAQEYCFEVRIDDAVRAEFSMRGRGCGGGGEAVVVSSLEELLVRGGLRTRSDGTSGYAREYFTEGHRVEIEPAHGEGADAFVLRWRVASRVHTPRLTISEAVRESQWRDRPIQREEVFRHLLELPAGARVRLSVADAAGGGERHIVVERSRQAEGRVARDAAERVLGARH